MSTSQTLPEPTKIDTWLEERKVMAEEIRQHAKPDRSLSILEAGCGTTWGLNISDLKYHLTGIDLDPLALEERLKIHKDLDDAICGDIRTVSAKENYYDIVFNSYVLEHIQGAEDVLRNFEKWLAPGGRLLLIIPNRDSVQGFITRITPFWFHVLFSKYIQGNKNAGKPGYAPYPTYYDKIVSRRGIYRFCEENNLSIIREYSIGHGQRNQRKVVYLLIRAIVLIIYSLSFGRLTNRHANLMFIIQKNSSA